MTNIDNRGEQNQQRNKKWQEFKNAFLRLWRKDPKAAAQVAEAAVKRINQNLRVGAADELKEIRQRDFSGESKTYFQTMKEKKNADGFFDEGILMYEDVAAVLRGVGELLHANVNMLEDYIQEMGNGPIPREKFDSGYLGEFEIRGVKIGVGDNYKTSGEKQQYGFCVFKSGINGPLDKQLVFEVARKLDEAGIPLVGGAADFVAELKKIEK